MNIYLAVAIFLVCFAILIKAAKWFVEGAVGIAERLNIPKMLIGLVLVSVATTAPELAVSVQSALDGHPEIALGNAVGSVICDDGVAIALAGLLAVAPIGINPYILRTSGIFLIVIDLLAYAMVFDGTLGRIEGSVLVLFFVLYMVFLYFTRRQSAQAEVTVQTTGELKEIEDKIAGRGLGSLILWFLIGLLAVIISSKGIEISAVFMAQFLGVSEAIIGLTIVAIGTSLPEIATCITAARSGQGAIAVGNIVGADILNICWIAGASAMANPLVVSKKVIHFSFPIMIFIVLIMLLMMRTGHRLTKTEGGVLLGIYVVYLALALIIFVL